ncbi:MAG: hypothetical protein J0H09_05150 [Burkholderiales bacterium]|nr:hypothetical protein [Burkholderiales bacterium]
MPSKKPVQAPQAATPAVPPELLAKWDSSFSRLLGSVYELHALEELLTSVADMDESDFKALHLTESTMQLLRELSHRLSWDLSERVSEVRGLIIRGEEIEHGY